VNSGDLASCGILFEQMSDSFNIVMDISLTLRVEGEGRLVPAGCPPPLNDP
jgi:hypothetical protein